MDVESGDGEVLGPYLARSDMCMTNHCVALCSHSALADHNSPFTININAVSSASVSSRGHSAPSSLSSCNCDVHINCFMSIDALDFEMDHSIIERENGEKKNSKEQYHQYLIQMKSGCGRCLGVFYK